MIILTHQPLQSNFLIYFILWEVMPGGERMPNCFNQNGSAFYVFIPLGRFLMKTEFLGYSLKTTSKRV